MKKVLITYHMTNGEEDAETCIALPMADEVAEDVLTWGDDSRYIRRGGAVRQALDALARMQGYSYTMFCTAELVQWPGGLRPQKGEPHGLDGQGDGAEPHHDHHRPVRIF